MFNATRVFTHWLAITGLMAAFATTPAFAEHHEKDKKDKGDQTDMPASEHQADTAESMDEDEAGTKSEQGMDDDTKMPASEHQEKAVEEDGGSGN